MADRQAEAHAAVMSWARRELGGDLEVSTSIFGADPPEAVLRNAEKRLNGMDAFELTATFNAAASAKSLLIGMALIRGAISLESAIRAARAEEDASIEEWGLVEGGHDVDQADITVRLAAPRAMMSMLRAGDMSVGASDVLGYTFVSSFRHARVVSFGPRVFLRVPCLTPLAARFAWCRFPFSCVILALSPPPYLHSHRLHLPFAVNTPSGVGFFLFLGACSAGGPDRRPDGAPDEAPTRSRTRRRTRRRTRKTERPVGLRPLLFRGSVRPQTLRGHRESYPHALR